MSETRAIMGDPAHRDMSPRRAFNGPVTGVLRTPLEPVHDGLTPKSSLHLP
jgi:hypothetical protein